MQWGIVCCLQNLTWFWLGQERLESGFVLEKLLLYVIAIKIFAFYNTIECDKDTLLPM